MEESHNEWSSIKYNECNRDSDYFTASSIAGTQLIKFINSKIKNNESAKLLGDATTIVLNAIRSVFQTFVESLKTSGKFDNAAQSEVLKKAKDIALSQMSDEVKTYIQNNYGDIQVWIKNQIEATINFLKNKWEKRT